MSAVVRPAAALAARLQLLGALGELLERRRQPLVEPGDRVAQRLEVADQAPGGEPERHQHAEPEQPEQDGEVGGQSGPPGRRTPGSYRSTSVSGTRRPGATTSPAPPGAGGGRAGRRR